MYLLSQVQMSPLVHILEATPNKVMKYIKQITLSAANPAETTVEETPKASATVT